jgi:hypothetical protein
LFCLVLLAAQVVISLDWEWERDLESGTIEALKIAIPTPYEPTPEVSAIQQYQREHSELGFLWKPSMDTADEVVIGWGDIPAGALTSDDFGFANSPDAIEMLRAGIPVDMVGVGASFMGGAQNLFHEYLALNGLFYYNMAHGRYTLPQYNIVLEEYALPLRPQWIVYGLNEVSFHLIPDFESWEKSGLSWFDYHSGTWCGPARKTGFPHDRLREYPRLYRVYQSVMKSLFRGPRAADKPSREELLDKTYQYVVDAWKKARDAGSGFILLMIPGKQRMIQGPSPALYLFEELLPRLREAGVPLIDLRESYTKAEDPRMLYFRYDGHWNRTGVYMAAREVLEHIENAGGEKGNE